MNCSLVHLSAIRASASPYRLLDDHGCEVAWANDFLDALQRLQRSPRSLRAYAFDLLHFARWWSGEKLGELTSKDLLEYVGHQLEQDPRPTAATVNHRLGVVRRLYRFHCHESVPGECRFERPYTEQSPLGFGRRRRAIAQGLRLTQPHRVILPLSHPQVEQFWDTFRTYRDLAIAGLMLLDGLRCCEILALQLADLQSAEQRILVRGKGDKQRLLPLPPEVLAVVQQYLQSERPRTNSQTLFVCLKGRHRGLPLSAAGLRSLFRHHRLTSGVLEANPHRFRHTFGADMVRDGMSLPALQHLMGHAQIRTTMLYVQLAPEDVWREYQRALEKRTKLNVTRLQ